MRVCLAIVFFFSGIIDVHAQVFGGSPPALHFRQINTPAARIIFPHGMDSSAEQVADIVDTLNLRTLRTIGGSARKINIIFRNQTTVSNGYVQLAPFRSEYELTPAQNSFELGSLPFYQTLAIHEFRHVQQYNNFRVGLSRVAYYLFGEEGLSLANDLTVPNWFFEGDAVFQETLVSKQGRGRIPFYFSGYRSLWLSQKDYSYMKLRNGSYLDYTPDHYPLGYMLVAYGRERYGPLFWEKVTHDAAAFKGFFYPLQRAIQKQSGISFTQFRSEALHFFKDALPATAAGAPATAFARTQKHFAADQEFPQFIDADQVVFVHNSYSAPPDFRIKNLRSGKEQSIRFRAVSLDDQFSYRNKILVYSALEPDIRWGWRDYGVLHRIDLETHQDFRLRGRTKYFSPDISADGQTIVAVNVNEKQQSALYILDGKTGDIRQILPNPGAYFFTYPKFYNSAEIVSAVRDRQGKMAVGIFPVNGSSIRWLTPFTLAPIGFVSSADSTVYFTASFAGNDRIFQWREGQLFMIRDSIPGATGSYETNAGFGKIAWADFTSAGYRMQVRTPRSLTLLPVTPAALSVAPSVFGIDSLSNTPYQLPAHFPVGNHPSEVYSKGHGLFNFHSWRPYVNDPDYTLSLVGENVLNTFQSEIYAGYNRNEQYKRFGGDIIYGGLFPWIDAGLEYQVDRNGFFRNQKIYWNELAANAGLSIPLNLSRGRWLRSLQGGADIIYHQRYFRGSYKDSFDTRGYLTFDPYLSFTNQLQAGKKQIYPSFAQTITLRYDRAITQLSGNQWLGSGYLYFPGIAASNSLVIGAAIQGRDDVNQIRFSNSFPFSRGYSGENFYRMYRLSANYHFPVAYPDWGFGNLVYFLRIRLNAFFDYTGVPSFATNGPGVSTQYRSVGSEIYFDTQWWNQLPVSFGIRYSHLIDRDYEGRSPNQWELILPLNLLGK